MQQRTVKYQIKAAGWEFASLMAAYAAAFVAAFGFIFMIFRAAHLIGLYQHGVDVLSYLETHIYVVLIEIVLWVVIARAAIRFKAYTRRIKQSEDGAALNYIANAMLLSFAYAILFDLASTSKTLFMRTPYLGMVTTVTNLLPLAIFLLLTALLYVGTLKLKRLLPAGTRQSQRNTQIIALSIAAFLLIVIPFTEYFYHMAPALLDDDGLHHFVLGPNILLVVYLLPFAVIWLLGLLSGVNLAQYASHVRGTLYKPMFRNLYIGILTSYASTYLIQIFYVSNVPSNRFGFGLLFLLSLIVMLIVGYGLMYRGANQLYTLER